MKHRAYRLFRALTVQKRKAGLLLGVACLLLVYLETPALSQTSDQRLTLQSAGERKASVLDRLRELEQSGLAEEEQQEVRRHLSQLLATLTAFEEAIQRRDAYRTQLENLPQRLQQVDISQKNLDEKLPPVFPQVTESLREEYEARQKELDAELNDLAAQATWGGVRMARIPEEIQALKASLEQVERQSSERAEPADGSWVSHAELLDARQQELRVGVEALEAERLWLIERGPLHDGLIRVARLRLERVQEALRVIRASLGKTFQEQQKVLKERVVQLGQALNASTSPAARVHLQVRLQTATVQQRTVDYQRQLAGVRKEIHAQEALNNQITQDANRLVSLAEQYGRGERIAQRLLIKFEHLRRERGHLAEELVETLQSPLQTLLPTEKAAGPLEALEIRLSSLNEMLFTVDEQIYEFDRLADDQANRLMATLFTASPNELAGALSSLRSDLENQRAALREQQQVLADLTQTLTRLIALNQDHRRLLDEGYRLALSRMLWLKNRPALGLELADDVAAQAWSFFSRCAAAVRSDLSVLGSRLKQGVGVWVLLVALFVALPIAARRGWSRLKKTIEDAMDASVQHGGPPRLGAALLIVLQAALWPACLVLILWSRQFLNLQHDDVGMISALVSGAHLSAVVLGVGLFSWTLFRPGGWGQQFWHLDEAGCRHLRQALGNGAVAALILLAPRQVVLAATDDPLLVGGGQSLERLLLLAFQGVVLVLVLRLGRPGGPLMAQALAHSRQQDGFLWRAWPFVHAILLVALAGVMTLDILGYRYTAQYIWLHGLETLSVILGSRLLLLFLLMYGARRFVSAMYEPGRRWHDPVRRQAADRSLAVFRFVSQFVLSVLGLLLILELWGLSVWSLMGSDVGSQIMTRTFIAIVTVAVVLLVIQGSNVLAEYILRPRLTDEGEAREIGRKLRTLTPLMQTILKVVVLFIAALVLLEQVNIRTGPLLAGLGLFGLAIGLASQSLIKDIINGLFILFEDSLSVGDIVTVRGIGGVVEKITLRVVVLRDLEGNVHVVPNSTIDLVTNRTKVFSRYLLDVGVAYRENVDAVIEILKEIDEEMRQDTGYGYNMLEPIEILGLDRFGDSAVYVRARLKTRPKKQWEVGREFNRRMKKVFDERGIEIPFPHRTVYWGVPKEGRQPSIRLSVNDRET